MVGWSETEALERLYQTTIRFFTRVNNPIIYKNGPNPKNDKMRFVIFLYELLKLYFYKKVDRLLLLDRSRVSGTIIRRFKIDNV